MSNIQFDKPLPSNEDAEQIILGSIILDNDLGEDAFNLLVPADFYNPINRRLFQAMLELHSDCPTLLLRNRCLW
jgi:replicative DNA helicase